MVTAIAAPAALRVTFRGGGGHAGALLMHLRADAGLAAAELALHVESATLAHSESDIWLLQLTLADRLVAAEPALHVGRDNAVLLSAACATSQSPDLDG